MGFNSGFKGLMTCYTWNVRTCICVAVFNDLAEDVRSQIKRVKFVVKKCRTNFGVY